MGSAPTPRPGRFARPRPRVRPTSEEHAPDRSKIVPLGPFDLIKPVVRGGMAVVWRGVHREQGVPVAVKVLEHEYVKDDRYLSFFRNEVRAVAGLDHPHIVVIFDHGEIPEETAALSGGRLAAQCPYLVMEWASGGSLAGYRFSSWAELRNVLLVLLDALAHAHARDVIHRDLKPGNVLRSAVADTRTGLKLADFGIARPPGALQESGFGTGTPAYMAPEQALGWWRDQGPWTDLYSVGCLVYKLATGSPPYGGSGDAPSSDVIQAHVHGPIPRFEPDFAVPPDFEGWLHTLLAKNPRQRFRRAADAAWALTRLGPAEFDGSAHERRSVPSASGPPRDISRSGQPALEETPMLISITLVDAPVYRSEAMLRWRPPSDDEPDTMPPGVIRADAPLAKPDMPPDWRRPEISRVVSVPLRGVGLGLYGLRPVPLVNREAERDLLWAALRRTTDTGSAHALVLEGSSGCGKSRLGQWLCERSHEVGASIALRAGHGAFGGPTSGLGAMIARHLRCLGAPRHEVVRRVRELLRSQGVVDREESLALAEIISPADHGGAPFVRFRDAQERYVLLRRLLGRIAQERPVVLWLDDVQWGFDALGFALHTLHAQAEEPAPILFALTAQTEALAERPLESAKLQELMSLAAAERLPVQPLGLHDRRRLVRDLLGLEGDLAARVEERTGGNPLFAVALVGDWVARGLLQSGPRGYRLQTGARVELPQSLRAVWAARLDRALTGRREGEVRALELAAVLGQDVDGEEWRAAIQLAHLEVPDEFMEVLLRDRLIVCGKEGPRTRWSFVHGMLRETVEARAGEHGRLRGHHRVCAAMLATRRGRDVAERRGRHLLHAEDYEEAEPLLLEGARRRMKQGEYDLARALFSARDEALRRLRASSDDPRWGAGVAAQVAVARRSGHLEEAERLARRALRTVHRHGWIQVQAQLLLERGLIAMGRGEAERAGLLLADAEELARAQGDRKLLGACRQGMADLLWPRGERSRAWGLFREALADHQAAGDELGAAACLQGMGNIALADGQVDEAEDYLGEALAWFRRVGDRWGVANAKSGLADAARFRGDTSTAERLYREAISSFEWLGAGQVVFPRQNLGILLVQDRRFDEARACLETARQGMETWGLGGSVATLQLALVACHAALGDWSSFDVALEHALNAVPEAAVVDADVALMAQASAEFALKAAREADAKRLWEVAERQWNALGRGLEAEQVAQRRQEIGGSRDRPPRDAVH